MAVTSSGDIVVNGIHLGVDDDLDAIVAYVKATGLPVFVGVVVPKGLHRKFVRELDDMAADVVGRFVRQVTGDVGREVSDRASGRRSTKRRKGQPADHARRR